MAKKRKVKKRKRVAKPYYVRIIVAMPEKYDGRIAKVLSIDKDGFYRTLQIVEVSNPAR